MIDSGLGRADNPCEISSFPGPSPTFHAGRPEPGFFKMGTGVRNVHVNFENAKDESLLHYYESVRRQVETDKQSGGRYRFAGATARQYADRLRDEMERRRLSFRPIDWP